MRKRILVIVGVLVILGVSFGVIVSAKAAQGSGRYQVVVQSQPPCTIPTFSIVAVKPDKSVTIQTYNFPPNDTFVVTMGKMGTMGIGGIKVATTKSGSGGSFSVKYNIPAALVGEYQIAIRLESPKSGYYAYNWFYNNTASGKPKASPAPSSGYTGYPTFSIVSVKEGKSVTIKTNNLPPNDTFKVKMNWMGTLGVGGEVVGTLKSGKGGVLTETFDIPKKFKDEYQIAIRLESAQSGYYAYNWFYNNTASGKPKASPAPSSGYTGYPTFSIVAVKKGKSVTIKTNNLPPNDTFVVRMNWMWTAGIGGSTVASFKSEKGGVLTKTFTIPAFLKDAGRIAIRFDSPTSGYYAYNWFYNNDAP